MPDRRPASDDPFRAVADPTRRAILERLSRGDATIRELAAPFRMTRTAVSQHLEVLEAAGLVTARHTGRVAVCTIRRDPLRRVLKWVEGVAERR